MYADITKQSGEGNQASRASKSNTGVAVQCQLTVGAVNDPLEHEADAMANKVMRMPDAPLVQRSCNCTERDDDNVRRKPLAGQITPFIQAKSEGGTASPKVSNQIQSTRGGGNPLPANTKTFMESRFGTDFSNVRIHTGDYAVQMSKELNAQAFTVGRDVYFNSGKFSPESSDGKHLLAHELTHTVQQGGSLSSKIQRDYLDGGLPPGGTKDKTPVSAKTPASGVCGPDISEELKKAVSNFRATFSSKTPAEQEQMCDTLTDRKVGLTTWDIVELHNSDWIYQNYRPKCATEGGSPACGQTVQVGSDCYFHGTPNYVIFGTMFNLCNKWKSNMKLLIWAYKSSSGNYEASKQWAIAGYDGWPTAGSPPKGDRNNCTSSCSVPFSAPAFNTRLCPHIDPYSQCGTPAKR